MEFICYPKCSTCQKAKKWLDENKIVYTERHIVEANPSAEELPNGLILIILKREKLEAENIVIEELENYSKK